MFRVCSEFSVMFRIFRICSEFSVMFRIFSEFLVIFRIFRHFSEYLAQKLVYSESLDFVVIYTNIFVLLTHIFIHVCCLHMYVSNCINVTVFFIHLHNWCTCKCIYINGSLVADRKRICRKFISPQKFHKFILFENILSN
jgi:hypothetical protein